MCSTVFCFVLVSRKLLSCPVSALQIGVLCSRLRIMAANDSKHPSDGVDIENISEGEEDVVLELIKMKEQDAKLLHKYCKENRSLKKELERSREVNEDWKVKFEEEKRRREVAERKCVEAARALESLGKKARQKAEARETEMQ
ncbi:uncharacterized protein LOC113208405 [Frankliniella occidentalis]|uniref:Uncharacterized protein LOC113208405 n=1 Tax=Frankliniella occidentalis TaxID=133901 RepID=A0A6J1SRN8_FRAOC|nr:uncharacterized protein LOC113208405 [Frankliniella occidentalis]